MNIFNSSNSSVWSGKDFELKDNGGLVLRKKAFIKHNVGSLSGRNNLKIIGKKRTGPGDFVFNILSSGGLVLFSKKISFKKRSYSEISVNFDINGEYDGCSIIIEKDQKSFGTIEVSKISISNISGKPLDSSSKDSKVVMKNCLRQNIKKKMSYFNDISKRKVAFIIPDSI